MNFTIGADPEFFVFRDKEFLNAHGLIEADKYNPLIVKNGAVQVDGMALEFNIDPVSSKEKFEENITSVMSTLLDMVGDVEIYNGATVKFSEKFFEEQPEISKVLGCQPDMSAYFDDFLPPPNFEAPMRTAGGHIHVGAFPTEDEYSDEHIKKCKKLAYYMDICLGIPSVLWDSDKERRYMYGKAGAFRPKSYGVEYRTLSNVWIFSKELRSIVFDQTVEAVNQLERAEDIDKYPFELAQIINKSDESGAKEYMKSNSQYYSKELVEYLND